MRPNSRESLKDSSTCSFLREASISSCSSSPRLGFARLIPIKSVKPRSHDEKIHHHTRRKKELHQRLEWIENIFDNSSSEHIPKDFAAEQKLGARLCSHPASPSGVRPRSQPASPTRPRSQPASPTGLPDWVIVSCAGGKLPSAPFHPFQKASKSAWAQRSCNQREIAGVSQKKAVTRPHSQQSKRLSTKSDESVETSPHRKRAFIAPQVTEPQRSARSDAIEEWCHHVLRQEFRKGTVGPLAFHPSPSKEPDQVPISPSAYRGTPTGKTYWIMLFGARRLAVKHDFRNSNSPSTSQRISDSLNSLSETEVIDLVRLVSKKEMDVLKDLPVLVDVWRAGGYPYGMKSEWIAELAAQESDRAFLDADEFLNVWNAYFDKLTDWHNELFWQKANELQIVDEADLPALFRELGFWLMPGALVEACGRAVPAKRRGKGITLTDFHKMYNDLYNRAGLTMREHARAETLFNAQLPNKSHCDVEQMFLLLKKLMPNFMLISHEPAILPDSFIYALAKELVIQVRERTLSLHIDSWNHVFRQTSQRTPIHDGAMGMVDINDFFVACNIMHQHIAERVAQAAERIGLNAGEKMNENDIINLFDELGHCSPYLSTFVEEALEDADLLGREEFTFAEVYSVLLSYLYTDSFCRAQREELSWLFNIFVTSLPDVEKQDGKLSISELKRALRWMCFTPSPHRLVTFMDWCGMSIADYVDLSEITNIVSNYRHSNIGMARAAFRELFEDDKGQLCSHWKEAPIVEFSSLMRLVGHRLTEDELLCLTESAKVVNGHITWREFLKLEECHRKNIKETLKNNLGFTAVEVQRLAALFNENKVQGTEFIIYFGFERIFPQLLPRMPIDAAVRKVIAESDMDGDHHIEFKEFLWIMRRLYDKDSKEELSRDQVAMDELGYTPIQVREMRELFNMTDKDLSGSLDTSEVEKLFAGLVDMSHEAEHELQKYLDQVDNDVNGTLDFWEFLGLMRTLEKNNWRDILRTAASQVNRLEELRKQEEEHFAERQFSSLKTKGLSHQMML